jgi:peptide/nickel transport system substrate-binding protein
MKRMARYVVLLLIAALALAGCGGAGGTAGASGGKPVYGGTFTKSLNYGDPGNLDPIMKSDIAAQMVHMSIFDTLVKYDPVKKQVVNSVAADYTVSSDGKTYTFTLKKGVKFHNGRELKAEDVKYTIERASTPAGAPVTLTPRIPPAWPTTWARPSTTTCRR